MCVCVCVWRAEHRILKTASFVRRVSSPALSAVAHAAYVLCQTHKQRSGVDKGKVDKCMVDSGGTDGDIENKILEAELTEKVAIIHNAAI